MTTSPTIPKQPTLHVSQDYSRLRSEGLAHVQRLGSALWTDYNLHDPGITLLELLCYAITDLGYRADFSIPDLIAERPKAPFDPARQGFFTARESLTISPLSVRDFRKKLIDLDGVQNAWLRVLEDYDLPIYADCAKSSLGFAPPTEHLVTPRGLYDVMVEFEDDAQMGNVNSGKVYYRFGYSMGGTERSTALVELRMPSWTQLEQDATAYADFRRPTSLVTGPVQVQWIAGNKTDDTDVHLADQGNALKAVLYATLSVAFLVDRDDPTSGTTLTFSDVPLRVWFSSDAARRAMPWNALKAALADASSAGAVPRYHQAIQRSDLILRDVRSCLMQARNLCEDWRKVAAVPVQDVAVCADIDVESAADIEGVLAQAYDRIDQYLSPDLRFRSLDELLAQGVPVEEIFEGPKLTRGFLDSDEVDRTELRTWVYGSDIINLLMDIEGVVAVRNFRMSRYDAEGKQFGPAEPWALPITAGHGPRFYSLATKFLVFKNGLPFLPNASELSDVLQVIRGRRARPKLDGASLDLPIERGTHRAVDDYYPAQYQLPRNYGVSQEGLSASVGATRLAQAKQLRAYLVFFEQLLVNYLTQLSHFKDLFAIDETVKQTYFSRLIDDGLLPGVEAELYRGLDAATLQALVETEAGWLERRNRILDHLLSRFAESFADYAVMLYRNADSKAAAQAELIDDKIAFLRDLPQMTHDRAKGFDYSHPPAFCPPAAAGSESNRAGLSLRILRSLGLSPPGDRVLLIEHLLLRPRDIGDPLLNVCLPPDCVTCGEEDPYSFRLTIVLLGEGGRENEDIDFRRFAENAIRYEVPAHLAVKVCWVSLTQFDQLESEWCQWLTLLRTTPSDTAALAVALASLLQVFHALKSVYPAATLHDCADGNDDNRVYLDRSVITAKKRGSDVSE